jgi:hypothetical protein
MPTFDTWVGAVAAKGIFSILISARKITAVATKAAFVLDKVGFIHAGDKPGRIEQHVHK